MEINKGQIVSYKNGYYRVTNVTKAKANLGAIFGNHIYHKGIAISDIDARPSVADEWYAKWTNSETYKCM